MDDFTNIDTMFVWTLAQMNHSELSHMAGAVDDSTINIVEVIIIIIINRYIQGLYPSTLLGAPVVSGNAQDTAIKSKIDDLSRATDRLKLLHAHDALVIFKNSLAIPKLLYLLRTSEMRYQSTSEKV